MAINLSPAILPILYQQQEMETIIRHSSASIFEECVRGIHNNRDLHTCCYTGWAKSPGERFMAKFTGKSAVMKKHRLRYCHKIIMKLIEKTLKFVTFWPSQPYTVSYKGRSH